MTDKTTEALKLAEKTLEDIIRVYKFETGTPVTTLAAIREALAESKPAPDGRIPKTVFTLEDIGAAREAGYKAGIVDTQAEPLQILPGGGAFPFVEVGYVGEFVAPSESLPAGTPLCVGPVQPMQEHSEQYWLHEINNARATGYEKGCASCKHDERMMELGVPVQPVKQESVGFLVHHGELCYKSDDADQSYGMWCPVTPDYQPPFGDGTMFYAAPVDAKAIRAEALEQAAAMGEESIRIWGDEDGRMIEVVSAIRRLK